MKQEALAKATLTVQQLRASEFCASCPCPTHGHQGGKDSEGQRGRARGRPGHLPSAPPAHPRWCEPKSVCPAPFPAGVVSLLLMSGGALSSHTGRLGAASLPATPPPVQL